MTAYAGARLWDVRIGPDIIEYLDRIDATLTPFNGRFVIHGGRFDRLEGDWRGDFVVIAFPDRATAHAWYQSPDYREIVTLRTHTSLADIILIDGVGPEHRAPDVLRAS